MNFFGKILDKLVDITEQYNRYKAAAMLHPYVKSRKELEEILNDLYGNKPAS